MPMESIKNWWNSPGASFTDPRVQALFGASSALMEAGRPGTRNSLASAMGQGLQGAMGGYNQGLQNQYMMALKDKTLTKGEQAKVDLEKSDRALDSMKTLFGMNIPGVQTTNPTQPSNQFSDKSQESTLGTLSEGENKPIIVDGRKATPSNNPFDRPDALQQIGIIKAMGGADLMPQFLQYHYGKTINAGDYQVDPDGKERHYPSFQQGITRDQDGNAMLVPRIENAIARVNNARVSGGEIAKNEYALTDSINPLTNQTESVLKRQAVDSAKEGNPVKTTLAPGVVKYAEIDAKAGAERYNELQNASLKAPATIAKYRQLGTLLSQHEGGSLSKTGLNIASLANSMGIKIDKNLPNKQAAEALSNELALSMRDPSQGMGMPGAMSDADRNYLADATPNLSQSLAGRTKLIDMKISVLERSQDVAKMSSKWVKRYGGLHGRDESGLSFQDHLAEWSDRNRLFAPKE